ncbi:MAG: hypothetical protein KME20_03570 [Kaiparowitsia implicata GSE-PSE-MK54-09C]|jgi:hypothetical protein|nr:hypothetical protein [Kaiparowitsia implicata GSE-PSE-MK54-09C]
MPVVNIARRLPGKTVSADVVSYNGLGAVENYIPVRSEATPIGLKTAYETMLAQRQKETELTALLKAAADASRQAEWNFHNAVLAMKESIRGQFGPDSDEAQSVGYKKKSEYKRGRRTPKTNAS